MASRSSETCTATRGTHARTPIVAALAVAAVTVGVFAQQGDRERTEALARRATDRLQALQAEADHLASQERTLLGDLRKLEIDREMRTIELSRITADADEVSGQIEATDARMRTLANEEAADRPALRARLVDLYKLGRGRYLRLLLSAADLRRVGEATRTVAALAAIDRERFAAHQRTLEQLKATRATLAARQQQLATLHAQAERAQEAAVRAADARNALIRDIDERRDLNAQLAGELQSAQQKLQVALRDLSAGRPAADPPALPLRPFRGDLAWPADGTVRRAFGQTAAGRVGSSNGIEIAAAEGAPAHAVHDGAVAFAGPFEGFGNLVIVDHGEQTFSLYGNLQEMAVKRGEHVDRGQALGTVGPTPAGAAGLYFELRVDGRPVDPLQWLKRK